MTISNRRGWKRRGWTRRGWKRGLGAVAVLAAMATGGSIVAPAAQAATTVAGDAAADAYADEAVRAMTWNICGEAGGAYPGALAPTGSSAFCPDRNQPAVKASVIASTAVGHDLNAIMLEEICGGPAGNLPAGSDLADIMSDLGAGWHYAWAPAVRPGDTPNAVGGSACRGGLTGTLGAAVIVKGVITSGPDQYQLLPNPDPAKHQTEPILCATVASWTNVICDVHMVNENYTSESTSPNDYDNEVTAVTAYLARFGSVVLGGDFNTSGRTNLAPLYASYAECDQQAYFPGDPVNEVTHFSYRPRFGASGTILDGSYESAKIDYLFASSGFTGCTSAVGLADQASYATAAQPSCLPTASPIVCTPTGISDHAPIIGSVKGGPDLWWRLNEPSGTTAHDSSGVGGSNATGALTGTATFSQTHGGAASFPGTTAAITTPVPVVDTSDGFTVSAWVDLTAGAPTSAILSQDAGYGSADTIPNNTSGFSLYYNSANATWRFAMSTSDSASSSVNEVSAAAHAGTWTQLTAVFDAVGGSSGAGGMTLYVNGVKAGSADHTAVWPANGPFVVGRRTASGSGTNYWHGLVQDVAAFRYPMSAAEITSYATKLAPPTQPTTLPGASGPARAGCDTLGGYGTVADLTPSLQVKVTDPNPSKSVHADFSIWDNTQPDLPQPIKLGGAGSASTSVTGSGMVSVVTPALIPGHAYGWYARTNDGSTSATMPVCHFVAGTP